MRRKFLSVVLCVCMMLTMAPFAFAAGTDTGSTTEGASTSTPANSSSGAGGGSVSTSTTNAITNETDLRTALESANDEDTITISGTISINTPLVITKTVTLTGGSITASDSFTANSDKLADMSLISLKTAGKVLTLKNITLDAKQKTLVVFSNAGKVVVDGATITGGKTNSYVAGVYMTSASQFEMNSGSITGNEVGDSYKANSYTQYAADLWIGANANGALTSINGGTIGNIFVNSNAWSASNPGGFTMTDGNVTNLYVEYDAGYGASFTYQGGTIENLYISTTEGNGNHKTVTPVIGMTYTGGQTNDDTLAPVAQVGTTTFGTLEAAITVATDRQTITLLKDTALTSAISIEKNVTLDLGGKTLSRDGGMLLDIYGNVTIQNGTIAMTNTAGAGAAIWVNQTAKLTVEKSATISAPINSFAIAYYQDCTAAEVTLKGTLTGEGSGITVNGLITDTTTANKLTIDGATINVGGHGIYQAGNATTALNNSAITGATGTEVRAGNLTVSNSTITGNGTFKCEANGNGTTTDGVGIAIAQHTTKLPINVTISGGTISGKYAVYESNPQTNDSDSIAKVKLSITNGKFNGSTAAVYSQDVKNFISGGLFTTDPTAYCGTKDGKQLVGIPSNNSNYPFTVGTLTAANVDVAPAAPKADADTTKITDDNVKQAMTSAAASAADTSSTGLDAIGGSEATKVTPEEVTQATTKLSNSGVTTTSQTVTLYVQPYLDITVTGAKVNEQQKATELSLSITPMVKKVASTAENADDIALTDETGKTKNATVISDTEVKNVNTPVTIKLALPTGFAQAGDRLSIKHTKENGSIEYYTGTVTSTTTGENEAAVTTYYVTFTTNGFSPFVIYAASANVASIDEGENQKVYPTLQAAIDAVQNNETITLLKNTNENVTVSKAIKFTLAGKDQLQGSIAAGSKYSMTTSDTTSGNTEYTFTYVGGGSSSSISTPTTYAVNVNAATNGAVAADKKTASKGTTVTVTASPSKGYVVDAVKVVDKDGKDVAVTEKDGKYVFTMPASAVTVTGSFKAETPAPVALPFSDVKSGDWFYPAVQYAYAQGLMTGTSATTFAPNGTMNRAMIVTVLYQLEKSPAVTGASKFTDVPAGQWYSDAVAWAAANKIVNGYDETTFGPMNAVTREQMAAILFRYEQVKGLENVTLEENLNRFPDQNKISAYAIPALQWAVGQKIINGNADGTLDPTGTATRAQVAQIFTNLLNK